MRDSFYRYFFFSILIQWVFLWYFHPVVLAESRREEMVNNQLDCVSSFFDDDKVDWEDVCYSLDEEYYVYDMRMDIVNEQMDAVTHKKKEKEQRDSLRARSEYKSREDVYFDEAFADDMNIEDYDVDDDDLPAFERETEPPKRSKIVNNVLDRLSDFKSPLVDFRMGTEHFYQKYKEPGDVEQEAFMNAVNAAYTFRTSENQHVHSFKDIFRDNNKVNMYRAEGSYSYGFYRFHSEDLDILGLGGVGDHNRQYILELRGLAGYDIPTQSKKTRITPYLGLGYRYLNDDSAGRFILISDNLTFAFERETRYFYVPIGVETMTKLKNDWSLALNLEYDYLLQGIQKNHYDDGGLQVTNTENITYQLDGHRYEQDNGFGVRGSAQLMKLYEDLQFVIEPYFRIWSIDDSETKQFTSDGESVRWWVGGTNFTVPWAYLQPDNYTLDVGVKLGVQF